jgi:hypothetical protein
MEADVEWILFGIGVIVLTVASIVVGLYLGRRWGNKAFPVEPPRPGAEDGTKDDE